MSDERVIDRERLYESAARIASALEPAGKFAVMRQVKEWQAAAEPMAPVTDADRTQDWAQSFTDEEWEDFKRYDAEQDRDEAKATAEDWIALLDAVADLAVAVPHLLTAADEAST